MDNIAQRGEPVQGWPRAGVPAYMAGVPNSQTTERPDTAVSQRLIECRREFLRFFRQRLSRPEDAEDALQDFCLKVVRAAEKVDDSEKIDAWLGRILRNTLIDHYRRRAAWRRAEAAYGREVEGAVVEAQPEQNGKPCCCVHDALSTLRPDYAEILRRADLNEEPRERIATELGLTTNNIGVRLHRARRALKAKLEKLCPTCRDGGFLSCDCEPAGEIRDRSGGHLAGRNGAIDDASVSRSVLRATQGPPMRPIRARA